MFVDVCVVVFSRVLKMIEQRKALIKDRRQNAAEACRQKEAIMKVMEELRTNASKANKIIAKGLSGDIPLGQLLTGGLDSTKGKSKGSSRQKIQKAKSTSELLNGSHEASYFENGASSSFDLSGNDNTPKPYVSPYTNSEFET